MAKKVTLPLLGQTMEEGTIIKWLKQEGDKITEGEPILEVMTDKANMEVEAPHTGTLLKIVAKEDETIPVKGLIAIVGEPGESFDDLLEGAASAEAAPEAESGNGKAPAAEEKKPAPAAAASTGGRVTASPRARKLAEENGVDIESIGEGSGPGGRIIEKDIQKAIANRGTAPAAAAAPAATPLAKKVAGEAGVDLAGVSGSGPGGKIQKADVEGAAARPELPAPTLAPKVSLGKVIPFTGLRKAVADNLEKSARTVIPVTLTVAVDMTEASKLREQIKPVYEQRYGVKLSFTDIIVKAAAKAIEDYPIINSSLTGSEIKVHDSVNMNVAVAVPDGLLAPVVKDANLKPMWAISAEIRDFAEKGRAGKLGGDDLQGGTFTLTNLGAFGIEHFNAIINPPQCAILAVCAIKQQPVAVNGEVSVRPMMNLCLTFDHRITDGAPAAQYVARVKELLEQPYLMLA